MLSAVAGVVAAPISSIVPVWGNTSDHLLCGGGYW